MKKRKSKLVYFIATLIMTIQLVVMAVFCLFVNDQLTKSIRQSTINSMRTITKERSTIIENHIIEAESYLTAYSRAGEITHLLKNPTDEAAFQAAQKYTETFSADRNNLEGIYASEWNSHVLTHTNAPVVGMVTRTGDPLKQLQDAMLAADGVYNTGIIISPASKQQIISMYRAVFDENGAPIGLVGGGIFTTGLKEILNNLPTGGLEEAKYYLINAATQEFIFHEDETLIGTVVEDPSILNALQNITNEETGFYESESGDIVSYNYMQDKNWVFILADNAEEIFRPVSSARTTFLFLTAMGVIALSVITFITLTITMRPLRVIEETLTRVAKGDITKSTELEKYENRKDDFGAIVKASQSLLQYLREMILILQDCDKEVDSKAKTLHEYSDELVSCVSDNIVTAEDLSSSLENVTVAASQINDEVDVIEKTLVSTLESMKRSNTSSDNMSQSALLMKQDAENAFMNSKDRLSTVKASAEEAIKNLNSLTQINELASSILDITEQTNLLALNASIESARAGEAGRSFAVVASEIKKLAETSGSTATNIQSICATSDASIATVRECIEEIIKYVESDILKKFEEFADRSSEYSDSVGIIQQDIEHVGNLIEELNTSVRQISHNVNDVAIATKENTEAIAVIVEKSENASEIANKTQKQSEENKKLVKQLDSIINNFQV